MLGHRTLSLDDYLGILKRRWMLIAIPAVVLPLLALAVTYHLTPIFTSQTLVLIDSPKVPDDYVKPVVETNLDSRLASMKEQILSRSRLEPIIKQYNLGDPKADMDSRIDKVRKDIDIKPIHSEISGAGGLPGFFIYFQAGDPHTAQQVCRQITSLFLSANQKDRQASAQGTTEFISEQLNDAKNNLDAQDAKLAAFQRENVGALPEDQEANMNMLSTLNSQLDAATQQITQLEQERSYREALLAGQSGGAVPEPGQKAAPHPTGQPTPEQAAELQGLQTQLADLLSHYTPEYPDVVATKRKISDLKKEIQQNGTPGAAGGSSVKVESPQLQTLHAQITSIDDMIQQKRRVQARIQGEIGTYQGRLQASPLVSAKYKELTRDYQTAQQFYDSLLTKK